ncbi:unnamed protein product [Diatraea saccharalis]|uniref:CRAL-TRIO domain-containing protein n=1 Tax=Diatraea saccharalis TaxID=40085 RepID=A0A9N9R791_9NEOP|nr:unnamed protein product [Diatraea saccharalis]
MAESKSPEEIEQQVVQFKEWIVNQSSLPTKDLDDKLIKRFLHSCYYNIDQAKSAIELFFSIRSSIPELLNDRDPLSPQFQRALKIVNVAQIRISGNRNLWAWQLNDPGLEVFDYIQDVRLFFLTMDSWLLNEEHLEDADLVMLDVKDISLKFLTKFNVSVAKKMSKYQQDALPIRLKQIHIVNAPPFIDKIFGLMKPFLKQEVTEMVHFHPPKSDTLLNYFDKDDLPEDYGGTKGRMEEHMKRVIDVVMSKRDVLLRNDLWRSEMKSKSKNNESLKDIGSFRTLAID